MCARWPLLFLFSYHIVPFYQLSKHSTLKAMHLGEFPPSAQISMTFPSFAFPGSLDSESYNLRWQNPPSPSLFPHQSYDISYWPDSYFTQWVCRHIQRNFLETHPQVTESICFWYLRLVRCDSAESDLNTSLLMAYDFIKAIHLLGRECSARQYSLYLLLGLNTGQGWSKQSFEVLYLPAIHRRVSAGQRWKHDWPGEPATNGKAGARVQCVCGKGQPSSLNEKFKLWVNQAKSVEVQSKSCSIQYN